MNQVKLILTIIIITTSTVHNLLHFGFQLFFNFEHLPLGTVHTKEVYGAAGASQSTAASTLKPTPVLVSSCGPSGPNVMEVMMGPKFSPINVTRSPPFGFNPIKLFLTLNEKSILKKQ